MSDSSAPAVAYEWRGTFTDAELNSLHAEAFGHSDEARDWTDQVRRHSLGWVVARDGAGLVGFVNVAWDGGVHAFVVDTSVARRVQRQGVGEGLVAVARERATASGCDWLHVDFEEHLRGFYLDACGFTSTGAGVIDLR